MLDDTERVRKIGGAIAPSALGFVGFGFRGLAALHPRLQPFAPSALEWDTVSGKPKSDHILQQMVQRSNLGQ